MAYISNCCGYYAIDIDKEEETGTCTKCREHCKVEKENNNNNIC